MSQSRLLDGPFTGEPSDAVRARVRSAAARAIPVAARAAVADGLAPADVAFLIFDARDAPPEAAYDHDNNAAVVVLRLRGFLADTRPRRPLHDALAALVERCVVVGDADFACVVFADDGAAFCGYLGEVGVSIQIPIAPTLAATSPAFAALVRQTRDWVRGDVLKIARREGLPVEDLVGVVQALGGEEGDRVAEAPSPDGETAVQLGVSRREVQASAMRESHGDLADKLSTPPPTPGHFWVVTQGFGYASVEAVPVVEPARAPGAEKLN